MRVCALVLALLYVFDSTIVQANRLAFPSEVAFIYTIYRVQAADGLYTGPGAGCAQVYHVPVCGFADWVRYVMPNINDDGIEANSFDRCYHPSLPGDLTQYPDDEVIERVKDAADLYTQYTQPRLQYEQRTGPRWNNIRMGNGLTSLTALYRSLFTQLEAFAKTGRMATSDATFLVEQGKQIMAARNLHMNTYIEAAMYSEIGAQYRTYLVTTDGFFDWPRTFGSIAAAENGGTLTQAQGRMLRQQFLRFSENLHSKPTEAGWIIGHVALMGQFQKIIKSATFWSESAIAIGEDYVPAQICRD